MISDLQSLAWTPFDPLHLLVIGVVALLLFGKRLPEVGRSLGRGIAEFKKGLHDVQDELSKGTPAEPPRGKLQAPDADADATASRRFLAGEEEAAAKPPERVDGEK